MAMTVELSASQPADTSAPPRAASGRLRRWVRPALGLLLPLGFALIWEIVVGLGLSSGRLVPPPTKIFATIMELARSGELSRHILATLSRVGAGFGLGMVAGTLLGAVSGYWGLARRLLDPTVQALRAIPSIAWVPLFILWLGIFETSKVALIAVGVFFPVYLGVMGAVLSVDRKIVEVGRVFRLSGPAMVRRILLPAVMPAYVVALRVGLGLGWMFVVAAEFMGASEGLGYLLIERSAARQARADSRRHRDLRHPRQDHRLADRDRLCAAVALAGRVRPSVWGRLMLVLDAIGKIYPNGVNALARFSAEIRLGEIVAIIGGSGCGKSTLLRAVAGLDRATSGTVILEDITTTAPHAKTGAIFQEPRLLPWLSVADNIGFGLSELPAAVRREKVARALTQVGLADKADAATRTVGRPGAARRHRKGAGAAAGSVAAG